MTAPGVIILAAGASRRLGKAKQLLEFQNQTLLRRAALTAIESGCRPVVVVLGANAEKFKTEIADLTVEIAVADDWADGMSRSIRAGLNKILEIEPDLSAVVLLLCDQPLVTAETIRRLIRAHNEIGKPIIAAEYEKTTGVPALFAREMWDELANLEGEAGAKFLIKKHSEKLAVVAAPEAAFDVDTVEDYDALKSETRP